MVGVGAPGSTMRCVSTGNRLLHYSSGVAALTRVLLDLESGWASCNGCYRFILAAYFLGPT
eukprot:1545790-Rhodomonas_salina.1